VVKVLSQSGNSLADIYDVEGSVAGIEQLETRELPIMHEMGATVFSERFSTLLLSTASGAILQSAQWNVATQGLPGNVTRIFGIRVFVDVTSRVNNCVLSIQDPRSLREMPIWAWDSANDGEFEARFSIDGAAAATVRFLQPAQVNTQLPHIMAGLGQPQPVSGLMFRGITNAFGAGNLNATALVAVGFTQVAGLSSRGLPVPSW